MRAEIFGSKGSIIIHANYNASERGVLSVNGREKEVLLPHRINGFEYQIEEAQRCIRAGLPESPLMPVADSVAMLRVLDEVRHQIGISYSFEKK
jgi:predicted dehydrogenase